MASLATTYHSVPRSSNGNKLLHAVNKMVEPTHQSRCTGNGFKPPKGALVKSQGIERLGKDCTMSVFRYL